MKCISHSSESEVPTKYLSRLTINCSATMVDDWSDCGESQDRSKARTNVSSPTTDPRMTITEGAIVWWSLPSTAATGGGSPVQQ